ncbi:hypothetical protein D3C87_1749280 [compost metagenome]
MRVEQHGGLGDIKMFVESPEIVLFGMKRNVLFGKEICQNFRCMLLFLAERWRLDEVF